MNKKIIIAGAVVAVVAVAGLGFWSAANSAGSMFEKGRKAMLTGNIEQAEVYLGKAAEKASVNTPLAAEARFYLGQCRIRQDDTEGGMGYMREAGLLGHKDAHYSYVDYLNADPKKSKDYISYFEELTKRNPDNAMYAAMLAKVYIFDSKHRDYDKAAKVLQPFVTRTGSVKTDDVNALAYASAIMSLGVGGYAESPEGASVLVMKCRRLAEGRLDDPAIDGFALLVLANAELINKAYNAEDKAIDNIARALAYLRAAQEKEPRLVDRTANTVRWLEDFLDEHEKVQLSPMWWDRNPEDWTEFVNHDTGFKYIGHTNLSGLRQSWGNNEYPNGWGCGVWTKEHQAFIGKWSGGKIGHGLFVNSYGLITER